MLTKGVLSFVGKSVLVGAIVPSLLFSAQANAASVAAKKKVKTSLIQNLTANNRHTVSRHQQHQTQHKKPARVLARTTTPRRQRALSQSQDAAQLSLGAFTLRAYTHPRPSYKSTARTSTGTIPDPERTIAVDPRVIPFGSRVYIEGIGERIAEDSGAKIKGKQIDVFLPSREHCRRFGVQSRDVMVMIE
jgi:3D (Asp-Asp-Asp) domain-containing protein